MSVKLDSAIRGLRALPTISVDEISALISDLNAGFSALSALTEKLSFSLGKLEVCDLTRHALVSTRFEFAG